MKPLFRILLIALLAGWALPGWGQSLIWGRRYGWIMPGTRNTDRLLNVVSLDDGTFLAAGQRYANTTVVLSRIDEQGDTLSTTDIPLSSYLISTYGFCRLSTGQVYIACCMPVGGHPKVRLIRVSKNGDMLWYRDLQGVSTFNYPYNVNHMTEGPNNTIIIAADCPDDPLQQANSIGYVACYDTSGFMIWDKEMREHPDFTLCNHIEPTPRGTVFVSGTAGSRIWAAELTADSGRELRRATFYQTPSLILFDYEKAWVNQAPADRFLVGGTTRQDRGYLGLHQGWAGTKIWGGEGMRIINTHQVNSDGSIVFLNEMGSASRLIRLRMDSTAIWNLPNFNPAGSEGSHFFSYASLTDSSAIGVGVVAYPDSTDWDWYIGRISNFGIPYNPAGPVAQVKAPTQPPAPRPYPSPCVQSLGFTGLSGPARLQLRDVQNRLVHESNLPPSQMADIAALPPGLYQYRLEAAGRIYLGRVMHQ